MCAIELGLFTKLATGPLTPAALAEKLDLDRQALLAALASLGYLEGTANDYRNSEFSCRALVRGAKDYEGDTALMSLWFMRQMGELSEIIRQGRGRESFEEAVSESPARASWLASAMDQVARNYTGTITDYIDMDGVRRLLDVGGADGSFAMALLAANPGAKADIFELPHVAESARQAIRAHGMQERIGVREGDFRSDELSEGYDLLFCSNIFHLCDEALARRLIEKAARALNPGGRLVIKDMVPRQGEPMPPAMAMFAVVAMTISAGGGLHDQAAYEKWCRKAGLESPKRIDCWERSSLLMARKPRD